MEIAFRVDASSKIGTGHVMRCLTLAKALDKNNVKISFICREANGSMHDYIRKEGFLVTTLPEDKNQFNIEAYDPPHAHWLGTSWKKDAEETIDILNSKIDFLIVDHYAIDYRWHEALREKAKYLMVIDDLADRKLSCDILLDQTHGRNKDDYEYLVPNNCKLLLGSDYALLRDEFFAMRLKAIKKRDEYSQLNRILISVGGMDPYNYTQKILKALEEVKWNKDPIIDVVVGNNKDQLNEIHHISNNHKLAINVIQDSKNMSELMVCADLAIGAGGSSSWERCCLGLPSLLIKVADNQEKVISELERACSARRIKDIKQDIIKECHDLSNDISAMLDMSRNAFNLVSGQGTKLVTSIINCAIARDGGSVTIRNANKNDADIMYEWQTNTNTRKFFKNKEIPTYKEHIEWMEKTLSELATFLYIIDYENQPAAVLRLNHNQGNPDFYLVSIYLSPDYYRRGIGEIALNYANTFFINSELRAEISEENIASINLFTKCGYTKNEEYGFYIRNSH